MPPDETNDLKTLGPRGVESSNRKDAEDGVQPERFEVDLGVADPVPAPVAGDSGRRLLGAPCADPGDGLAKLRRTDPRETDPAVLVVDVEAPTPPQHDAAPLTAGSLQCVPCDLTQRRRLELDHVAVHGAEQEPVTDDEAVMDSLTAHVDPSLRVVE